MKKAKKTKFYENKKFKTRNKPKLFGGADLTEMTDQIGIAGEVGSLAVNSISQLMSEKARRENAPLENRMANAATAAQIQRAGLFKGGYVFGGDPIGGDDSGKAKNTATASPFTVESWKKQGVLDSLNRGQMLKGTYADFNKHFGVAVPAGVDPNEQTFHINPGKQVKGKPVMFNTVMGQTVTHDKMGQNAGGLMTFKKGGKMKKKHAQIDPFLDDGQEGKFNAPSLRFGGPVPTNQQKAFYTWMLGETCDEDFNTKGEQRTYLDPDREAYPDKKKKAAGGNLLANKLGVVDGGDLQPVSNDAVEVKADNPQRQDSVELQDAFVDDGEIIDRKNRVFSEVLGYAKQAKKLEKQKSKNSRFSEANERIEQKLDALFQHQEQSKKQGIAQTTGKKKEATSSKKVFAAGGKYRPTTYERKSSDEVNIGGRVKLKKFDPTVRMKEEDKVTAAYGTVLRMKPEDDLRGNFLEGGLVPAKDRFIEMSQNRLKRNSNQQLTKASFWPGGDLEDMNQENEMSRKRAEDEDKQLKASKKTKRTANLKTAGNMLATYGPNVAAGILQGKLKGPAAPQGEQYKALERVRPDAQLAAIDRDSLAANQGIKNNTAQASDIASGYGMILAKKLAAQNEVYGQNQALNAQIQHQEAGLNVGIGMRNVERQNAYRQSLNDFSNLKTRLTSENIANVGQKYMLGEKEKNQMDLDRFKFGYAQKQFEDSGVFNRQYDKETPENQALLKSYGYNPNKADGGWLYGHYLNRSRERDELKKGGKISMTRKEFLDEHQRLLGALKSEDPTRLHEEHELPSEEMKEHLKKGGIYIKPENRGKFTATKKRTGKTTEELTHSSNPKTRKRAIFAQNAKKWHHK